MSPRRSVAVVVGATGGLILGILSSLALEAVSSSTEDNNWLIPYVFLGLPVTVGVLAALWARTQFVDERLREGKVHALALTPVPGWMVGFAATHALVGYSAVRRGVGTAVMVGVFTAMVIPAVVAMLDWARRRQRAQS